MQTIDMFSLYLPVCSVMRTIWYTTHLYGKMAFVKALLYLCRSSMEIQHALCCDWQSCILYSPLHASSSSFIPCCTHELMQQLAQNNKESNSMTVHYHYTVEECSLNRWTVED